MLLHVFAGWVTCCYCLQLVAEILFVGLDALLELLLPLCRACTWIQVVACRDLCASLTSCCLGCFWLLWSLLLVCLRVALWRYVWWPYPLWFGACLLFLFNLLDCYSCIREHVPSACSRELVPLITSLYMYIYSNLLVLQLCFILIYKISYIPSKKIKLIIT
jgi:hypothetical protein